MKQDILERWLENSLSEAEEKELVAWLQVNEANRREFALLNYREQQLRVCIQETAKWEGGPSSRVIPMPRWHRIAPRRPWIPAAAAATILVLLGVMWLAPSSS
ncbi:MAG: hypothetical protein AAF357_02920, partial [Verrucomicrobiota bacterium]